MSLIKKPIDRQAFELIRDRICQILLEEIRTQAVIAYDNDFLLERVYMERLVAFDKSELKPVAINVGVERGDNESMHLGQDDMMYRYFIEITGAMPTNESTRGDQRAKVLVQKYIGVIQAILRDPIYKTLRFSRLIRHTHTESFVFAESTREDASNTNQARMAFIVKTVETNKLLEGDLIGGYDTTVKMNDTDQGYYWSKPE